MTETERFAAVINGRMKNVGGYITKGLGLFLGTIKGGLALRIDGNSYDIPPSDYMVCRVALLPTGVWTATKDAGDHQHAAALSVTAAALSGTATGTTESAGIHQHEVISPPPLRPVKEGDRVLVAMAGTEPVVIDIVLPADSTAFKG